MPKLLYSKKVLDFTLFPYGSSCNYVFFQLILAPLLYSYFLASPRHDGMHRNRLKKKRNENKTKKERIT